MENEILNRYCLKLISKNYALLCSFEGRGYEEKTVIYPREIAYDNYLKGLNKLKIELSGCVRNYPHIIEFEEMRNIIEGLKDIEENEHELLRTQIFNLIDICKKIQDSHQSDIDIQ